MLKVLKYFFLHNFIFRADNASQKSHGSSSGGGGYTNGHSGGVSHNYYYPFYYNYYYQDYNYILYIIIIIIIIIPGQSELQPALDGRRAGINSDHKNSKAAHHSECEKQWQSNYIRYKHSQCEQPECENCETGCE